MSCRHHSIRYMNYTDTGIDTGMHTFHYADISGRADDRVTTQSIF